MRVAGKIRVKSGQRLNTELTQIEDHYFQYPHSQHISSLFYKIRFVPSRLESEGTIARPAEVRFDRRAAYLQLGFSDVSGSNLRPACKRPLHG